MSKRFAGRNCFKYVSLSTSPSHAGPFRIVGPVRNDVAHRNRVVTRAPSYALVQLMRLQNAIYVRFDAEARAVWYGTLATDNFETSRVERVHEVFFEVSA